MPNVTVVGPTNGPLHISSGYLAAIAQELANAIDAGVANGSLVTETPVGPGAPSVPAGQKAELVITEGRTVVLSPGDAAVVVNAPNLTLIGDGETNQSVLSGTGGLTYLTMGGSGTVVAGGGANHIITSGGPWEVETGAGNDTLQAMSGAATIGAGAGDNTIILGSGTALVDTTGNDKIQGGSGNSTVNVEHGGLATYTGGAGSLLFIDSGAGSTVMGGTGSETIFGSSGGSAYYTGGSDGNNYIQGAGTLIGGGTGDQLFATGSANSLLQAGSGNETLSAALSSGHDIFQFEKSTASGAYTVSDFTSADTVNLVGYAANAAAQAEKTATVAGGSTTFHLANNVTITFTGVSDPKSIHIT